MIKNIISSEKHSYILLDGFRGIAAIAVTILHMPRVFDGFKVPNAHLAVDFFLQLSGFVIAYAYCLRISNGMSIGDFAWRRFNRLYPTYILGFLLGVAVASAALFFPSSGLSVNWSISNLVCSAIPNLVMLPQFFCWQGDGLLYPLNPPMWTIMFEFIVNILLFPMVIFGFIDKRRWNLILIPYLFILLVIFTYPKTIDIGFNWSDFGAGFIRIQFSFLIGVLIFQLHSSKSSSSDIVSLLLMLSLAVVMFWKSSSYLFEILMITAVFPVLILFGIRFNPSSVFLCWLCRQLGVTSFVLYVLHKPLYQIFFGGILKLFPSLISKMGGGVGIIMLILILLISWVVARVYEPYARELLNKIKSSKNQINCNS